MRETVDVAIAGAGPSGLCVAAALSRLGVGSRILERGEVPASSWAGHYRSLRLHTSRALSELPGLPLRSATPYATRDEFIDYCADYARAHELDVLTQCEVTSLQRDGGRWHVATTRGDLVARHVVVATGCFGAPRAPEWPGREAFGGRWLTPRDVDDAPSLAGLRVLVAGLGNTGADMIAELARKGARVTVSVREPLFIVPLELLGVNVFRWTQWFPERVAAVARRVGGGAAAGAGRLSASLWATVETTLFGDLRSRGLELAPANRILRDQQDGRPPLVEGDWVRLVRERAVGVRPEIVRLTTDAAEFAGGAVEPFDAILPAAGLDESRFPLSGEHFSTPRDGTVEGRPGLWICGAVPALRHIRRAARRIAREIATAMRQDRGHES